MCGIFACIHSKCSGGQRTCPKEEILQRLKRRGPDHMREVTMPTVLGGSTSLELILVGTLLRMRGEATPQPVRHGNGNQFLWNGNIFGGQIEMSPLENDTVKLFLELNKQVDTSGILSTLSKVQGPWSFVLWQHSERCLWFGRDVFGRRSLLWHLPSSWEEPCLFSLSSVAHYHPSDMPQGYWSEVPAAGVYKLHLSDVVAGTLVCYPWKQEGVCFQSESGIVEELSALKTCLKTELVNDEALQVPFPSLNKQLPAPCSQDPSYLPLPARRSPDHDSLPASGVEEDPAAMEVEWSAHAQDLLAVLQRAIERRVCRAPHVSSTSLREEVTTTDTVAASDESVGGRNRDLSSPSEQPVCAVATVQQDTGGDNGRKNSTDCVQPAQVGSPERDPQPSLIVSKGDPIGAGGSSGSGLAGTPLSMTSEGDVVFGKARVAVLFSGGVDSAVMAALTDRCLDSSEEIDLINVAFEQKTDGRTNFEVPDRVACMSSLAELNPQRKWNVVLVNVTLSEVNEMRKKHVSQLVYPLCTVLDDSIGCALWFGARASGLLWQPGEATPPHTHYHSRARTLFVGIGADEQLAGYSRHRTRFRSGGWAALVGEMEMDIKRLARRNLGRDDRCIADHEREGQFPFLDEEVVTFLQQQPVQNKVDLSLPRGIGEKRLLREVSSLLGCHAAAALPKRAIQFGSRMAKISGSSKSREHGSDVCQRLLPTH